MSRFPRTLGLITTFVSATVVAVLGLAALLVLIPGEDGPSDTEEVLARMDAELRRDERGWLTFRYRRSGAEPLRVEWRRFVVAGPDGERTTCTGNDSSPVYSVGEAWIDFYVGCVTEPAPGEHRLLYDGIEVDRIVV